jgi:hypothetical protein
MHVGPNVFWIFQIFSAVLQSLCSICPGGVQNSTPYLSTLQCLHKFVSIPIKYFSLGLLPYDFSPGCV